MEKNEPLPINYIYQNYKYEPEVGFLFKKIKVLIKGCYKSCYQNQIIQRCGCADPRYPFSNNKTKLCDSLDPLSRKRLNIYYFNFKGNCLLVEGLKFTRHSNCKCRHRCESDVYTTTFSSAKLTKNAFKAAECAEKDCVQKEFDT